MSDNKPENIRVEVSVEATVNLGDFQNVKPGYKVSGDVPQGGNPHETKRILESLVEQWLEDRLKQIEEERRG